MPAGNKGAFPILFGACRKISQQSLRFFLDMLKGGRFRLALIGIWWRVPNEIAEKIEVKGVPLHATVNNPRNTFKAITKPIRSGKIWPVLIWNGLSYTPTH
jgi:hypothetical protein